MKLLYLHSASLDSPTVGMHQVVSMCNAFAENGIITILSLPDNNINKDNIDKFYSSYKSIKFELAFRQINLYEKIGRYLNYTNISSHINELKPDFIYTKDPSSLHISYYSKVPFIFEFHNDLIFHGSKYFVKLGLQSILNQHWTNFVIQTSQVSRSGYVAISENLKKFWIRKGITNNKIVALHDGFDEDMFNKVIEKNHSRDVLRIQREKQIAVYTGNLFPDREIEKVIFLAKQIPEAEFYIVGGPEKQKTAYSQLALNENVTNIHFKGQVDHKLVPLYLAASDILLAVFSKRIVTINYCSPLKVFEYMAAGKTIVAHGFPTIKEVLRHNENSLLVNPDSFDDLVIQTKKALSLTINNHLGITARHDAFEKYTWKGRAKAIIQHFF